MSGHKARRSASLELAALAGLTSAPASLRLSNCRLAQADYVFVRWSRPVEDPTPLLASRINESLSLANDRRTFVRSQTHQRAASMGISSLLSCAIELEAHQIEVVRRVLQDPVQRYLLADEVGLGKTIEAGVLIRQCILDSEKDCIVLIITPATLIHQWRNELITKFSLWRCLSHENPIIHLLAFDSEDDEKIRDILPKAAMLVVDEAHRLTSLAVGGRGGIYADIARLASRIERVLLLSATPALHNERGFLEMLHLLDSSAHPLEGEEAFRRKVKSRQALAEIVAGLIPENVLYLDYTLDQISSLFPKDALLQEYVAALRIVVETMPSDDDPALVDAIARLRAHISEVYRLHRRILRHRRRNIRGLTPERTGAEIVRYRSTDRAALTAAIDEWRFSEAVSLDAIGSEELWKTRASACRILIDRASQYSNSGPGSIGLLSRQAARVGSLKTFTQISRCITRPGLSEDRADALIDALKSKIGPQEQCVVFCSDPLTADSLAKRIAQRLRV